MSILLFYTLIGANASVRADQLVIVCVKAGYRSTENIEITSTSFCSEN